MKRAWAALLVTLVLVIPARLFVTLTLVDPKTGFYTDGGKMAAIIAVVTAAGMITVIAMGHRKTAAKALAPLHSAAAGVLAALTGVFIAGQSLVEMAATHESDYTVMDNIFAVAGLFAAVSFLIAAYDFAAGETVLHRHPLLALLSSVWGCLGLITLFVNYAATVNRFENVYHTCTVAFLLLFLFSQAKLLSGIDQEKGGKLIYSYGFAAVILALSDAVPNLVRYFSGKSTLGMFPIGLHMANVVLAVYILIYLSTLRHQKTDAVILSVAPSVGGSEENLENGTDSAWDDGKTESTVLPEKSQNQPLKEGLSSDSVSICLEFLKNAYQSEDKFVENRENAVSVGKTVKS